MSSLVENMSNGFQAMFVLVARRRKGATHRAGGILRQARKSTMDKELIGGMKFLSGSQTIKQEASTLFACEKTSVNNGKFNPHTP